MEKNDGTITVDDLYAIKKDESGIPDELYYVALFRLMH